MCMWVLFAGLTTLSTFVVTALELLKIVISG